jgi:dipeptidyl aminopeptidase/acylaminoacyl peptidase
VIASLLSLSLLLQREPTRDLRTTADVAAAYARADSISRDSLAKVAMLRLESGWIDGGKAMWFREDHVGGTRQYMRVDTATGKIAPLFDHKRLAGQLSLQTGQTVDEQRLALGQLTIFQGLLVFIIDRQGWQYDPVKGDLLKTTVSPAPVEGPGNRGAQPPGRANSGLSSVTVKEGNLYLIDDQSHQAALTTDGTTESPYMRPVWSADDHKVVALRLHPGDRKKVYRLQLSPPGGGQSKLMEDVYDRPGDNVDKYDVITFDVNRAAPPIVSATVDYGGAPFMRRTKDGSRFLFPVMDRGYGRWRIMSLDPATGATTAVVDEDPPTFVDSTSLVTNFCRDTDEIIFSSERDGWNHLYLSNTKPGGVTQITKGSWVMRGLTSVDEKKREIVFQASGMNAGEDPYFIHFFRIGFDGKNMVELTPSKGTHTAQFSPDGRFLVDTYSTVVDPQVHELRDAATGKLIAELGKAEVSELMKTGWKPAQPFVAKARDGQTDIYGIVYKPSNFDPNLKYPVVEDIYAGPQDSFVRKSFSVSDYDQTIAELGFIVVKIDGMGTRNRSKAFHDVCYKNLKDAGFPDRILWMRALAAKEPSMDIDRVGVFGTSAGGQNAAGAVLFHPEFYKVAVASCGCHDNRLDKVWWNEQWMGLIGPHYSESSNIDNAAKLKGDLLLIVGELDSNVPPESTYRLAAALQAANKEFDFVVIPNTNHTAGGPYGERKRRDFLVRHLLGVEPPNPNRN